ncbi:DUF4350 domain-containing protein [Halobellus sp. EA9]|uniref:DUF4350 domain-containing protein n=1 Tax=Halobellus sp. EA9 TaxID=3421647 RepID=UPI003EBC74FD
MAWDRPSYPQLLLYALAVVLGVTIMVSAGTSTAAFGAYNPAWDGTSEVRKTATTLGADPVVVQNTTRYQEVPPESSVAVVFSPTESYTDREAARLREFVRAGGTLLIADDFREHSNPLLAEIGANARIDPVPLRDERRAGPSPAFPRATAVANHTYTQNASAIMLNHGGTVRPSGATVLFASSEFSYRDLNRDETLNSDEQLSRHPVVTVESVGDGDVIVASDASLFLNAMVERADNGAFLRSVVAPHDAVLVDVSHTVGVPPLVAFQLLLQRSGWIAFLVGTASVIGVVGLPYVPLLVRRLRTRREAEMSDVPRTADEIAAGIRERHPEWDADRIERVTDSLMRRRQQPDTDD